MPATSRISSCQICDSYDVRRLRFEEFEWKAIVDWNREYWGVKEDLSIHADPDCQYCCGKGETHGKPCHCVDPKRHTYDLDVKELDKGIREMLALKDEGDTEYVKASEFRDRMMKYVVEKTLPDAKNARLESMDMTKAKAAPKPKPDDLVDGEGYCVKCGRRGHRLIGELFNDMGWFLSVDHLPPAMVCPDCLGGKSPQSHFEFVKEYQNEPIPHKCFQCGQLDDASGAYALRKMGNGEYLCPRCLMSEGYRKKDGPRS